MTEIACPGAKVRATVNRDGYKKRPADQPCFIPLVQVDLPNNITFLWDGEKIGVDVPQRLRDVYPEYTLMGLLGTYNNHTDDDFMGPDGEIRKTAEEFGSSWLVPGSCSTARKNHTTASTGLSCLLVTNEHIRGCVRPLVCLSLSFQDLS